MPESTSWGGGAGPDPPQFPPWVWAFGGLLGGGLLLWGASFLGGLLGGSASFLGVSLRGLPGGGCILLGGGLLGGGCLLLGGFSLAGGSP